MKKQTVTMEAIARAAGVSQSTVSLALNGRGRISTEVREQIRRVARELGYALRQKPSPDRSARGSSVGVLLDQRFFEILDSYFIRILRGLQAEAEKRGAQVVFATVGSEHLKTGWRSVFPTNVSPDGLVVVGVTDPDFTASFNDANMPVVFAAAGVAGSMRFDTVTNDDAQGMQEVLTHLKSLGHRRIAFVGGSLHHLSSINRLRGYKMHMDELFGAYDHELIECAEEGSAQHAGFETCSALLARHAEFTALVCMTDEMARGAVEALIWSGLRVPEDVSVVGFDNKEIAQVINPPLTTVQINCEEMGRIACEVMLLRLSETASLSPLRVQVAPELIVRSSTASACEGSAPWTRSRYGRQMAGTSGGRERVTDSGHKNARSAAPRADTNFERLLSKLSDAIISGRRESASEATARLLELGANPKLILERGLIAGMDVVGTRFKLGEYFVPQVLVATRAMKASMECLRPHLLSADVRPLGTMVLGTVRGDLHDIGKSLVGMMTEGAGFRVIDLGVDISPAQFVAAAREHRADLVGVSALLTNTMMVVPEVINAIEAAGLRGKVKVIVGGAPVTRQWAAEVGADGYAPDAASAVDICRELVRRS